MVLAAASSLTYAAPASGDEYSIYEWWTNKDNINKYWGNYQSGATAAGIWGQMVSKELWSWSVDGAGVNPPPSGKATLQAEYTALKAYTSLWMYEVDGGGNIVNTTKIFDGSASPVPNVSGTWQGSVSLTNSFGFFITYADPQPNRWGTHTWYTEEARNGQKQSRVFTNAGWTHPTKNPGWIIAWEDQNAKTGADIPGNKVFEYDTAWSDPNSLTWGANHEPDYQDMILTFSLGSEDVPGTPELSTWLLVGLSLAAVPVLRRRRRS